MNPDCRFQVALHLGVPPLCFSMQSVGSDTKYDMGIYTALRTGTSVCNALLFRAYGEGMHAMLALNADGLAVGVHVTCVGSFTVATLME